MTNKFQIPNFQNKIKSKINYRRLKAEARRLGAELFGVADISAIKSEIELPLSSLAGFNRAICLGVGLSGAVLNTINDAPNKIYFHHYRTANALFDQLAFRLVNIIQFCGFDALSIPASQILDWQKQTAHLSHKKFATLAGLGWIGRNNLLVNKRLGSQFRLVTILTDMPLAVDRQEERGCGECRDCIAVCPVGAIKEKKEDFDHIRCFEKLKEFQKSGLVGQYICGICVKACRGKC